MVPARLDRQLRIPEWRQELLSRAQLGVVGDDGPLTSLLLLGTAALGINTIHVIAPQLDGVLLDLARALNPDWRLHHLVGHLTHPLCLDALRTCHPWVDLSHYALASKIILEGAFQQGSTAVVRGHRWQAGAAQGLAVFTYQRGREWQALREVLPTRQLPPANPPLDGALDIITAGLILEEVKTILMAGQSSATVTAYCGPRWPRPQHQPALGIIGAGALGNFVGLGLALAGYQNLTFIDPDIIEVTNLNRQILFGGAVGLGKAQTLAARLHEKYGLPARAVTAYFQAAAIGQFDLIFDCMDNFASRIALSEACAAQGIPLVSGGADVARGQVVAFHPQWQPQTPAALLNMPSAASENQPSRPGRAACLYQPNPAVVMTNQVIGGFMVEAARHLLAGQPWPPLFYDAASPRKFEQVR